MIESIVCLSVDGDIEREERKKEDQSTITGDFSRSLLTGPLPSLIAHLPNL